MLELVVDVLDQGVARVQLILASVIALLAIFFTLLKAMLAEREAFKQKRIREEMAEYKEEAMKERERKRQEELKRWQEGEEWPIQDEEEEEEKEKRAPKKKKEEKGGGKGGQEEG